MKIRKFPKSFVKSTMPLSASVFKRESRRHNNQWSLTRENGKIGSKLKVQSHSPWQIFKQETRETFFVRIILVSLSFASWSALWINIVKRSKISVRFLKFKILKLILITRLFPVIAMLKLTKVHKIKGNNSFRLQHFFDKHMVFGCKQLNITPKALQMRWLEKSTLCDYLSYERGKPFLFKERPFIQPLRSRLIWVYTSCLSHCKSLSHDDPFADAKTPLSILWWWHAPSIISASPGENLSLGFSTR